MQVLVTGCAGRIGAQTARMLLERGDAVVGFDLRPSQITHVNYSEVVGTFDDPAAAARAVEGAQSVLHLGAFMSWRADDREMLFAANVDGTRRILEAAAGSGVRRFVFASSGEVYPENRPERLPITEEHPLAPTTPYGVTKLIGEVLVRFHARVCDLETVILRFSHTQNAGELLDPDSFFSGPRFFLHPKIRQQEGIGNAAAAELLRAADPGREALVLSRNQAGRPYRMHITETRDIVAGILLALDHPCAAGGTFNLGATEPVDFADLVPAMAEATGLPVAVVDLPGAGVWYQTSNARIRETLGFTPEWPISRMLTEAVGTWTTRHR